MRPDGRFPYLRVAVATVAMAAVALGSLFHYVMKGPNEVSKELEDEMEKEDAQ